MKITGNWWFIKGRYRRIINILCFLIVIPSVSLKSQGNEGLTLPESECREAFKFIGEEHWMRDSLEHWGIDPDFAIAIVFPEILRYSAVRDWAETRALEMLYVQYGKDYADFSIGHFQMKPSFTEQIEADYQKLPPENRVQFSGFRGFSLTDDELSRRLRIERMKDIHWQLRYLVIFCKVMEEKYNEYSNKDIKNKLIFYATAYNTGYNKPKSIILKKQAVNDFYITIRKPEKCWNYSEVAEWGMKKLVKFNE